jgi:division protein CdvB (Snf7/Vps24/ESCRT-III family)
MRSNPPLREVIVKSIQTLKVQHGKLEQASFRLKERDRILFQTCVNALNNKNRERAAICANEIAEVRKLLKFLYNVEIAIERVILRLETIRELSDIVIDLKPALKILQGVSQQLFDLLPDVSAELNKVSEEINETLYSTRINADEAIIPVNIKTPEGEEVLKEVSGFLERKIAEKLPEPPATLEIPQEEKAALKQLVALTASCSQAVSQENVEEADKNSSTLLSFRKAEIQEISLKVENSSLEDLLLEYIKKCNGEIDMRRCSVDLKASREEIEKALESLDSKGKIKIELKAEG